MLFKTNILYTIILSLFYFNNVNSFTNININNNNNIIERNKNILKTSESFIPDIEKRNLMNSILMTSLYGSCGPLVYCYFNFFAPPGVNNKQGGVIAKDKNGDDVLKNDWLTTHSYPSRALVQGLKGDAYYLITSKLDNQDTLEKYALNAVCTHLGCVVPWNVAENKFMCPCHGSQYDNTGKVIRGPAPRSLALAHVEENNGKVSLSEWTETDFRTNEKPWWI